MYGRKINVLHVIGQLPLGGAEMLLLTLAANIDRNKINLVVCCLDEAGPVAEQIKKLGIKLYCFQEERFRYFFRKLFNLAKTIKEEKIDIVHTHLQRCDFWGRLIAFLCRAPIICMTRHDYRGGNEKKYPDFVAYYKLNPLFDYLTDMMVYISDHQADTFMKREKERIVVYNGVYEKRFAIADSRELIRKKLGISPKEILIGSVGRLTMIKGQKYLLSALREIINTRKDVSIKLLLAGDGEDENDLRVLGEKLGIKENIIIAGRNESIPQFLQAMDIYVHPALFEPFGIAIIEAMYSGLPVIASNVGGIPEIIQNGVNGILTEAKNPNDIAAAIMDLIDNPAKAIEMAKKGKDTVLSKFTGKIYAEKVGGLYEKLMGSKR